MQNHHPLSTDLSEILNEVKPAVWNELRGARLFITGGTGFFGKWLLESWAHANRELGLRAHAVVLARNPEAFLKDFPHLANDPSISFLKGDLLDFKFPKADFTHILHAATPASVKLDRENPALMRDIIVRGTERMIEFVRLHPVGARPKLLMTSSGAVYGVQPTSISHVGEDYNPPESLIPDSAYARGKREAEALLFSAADLHCVSARCFAFAGPHFPVDQGYAFGNFIRDGARGGPIIVSGDGTPLRSYLYASDLTVWLWTLLVRGVSGRAYNVGSDEAVSIGDLARKIAEYYNQCAVEIAKTAVPGAAPARYVPSIERARSELGLRVSVGLDEAIARTAGFMGRG